ncbi:MAG: nucleotidyltransferase family protein [Anaerolineaceae bacterium]|nr:nucleotidyltransferase family protein [Anaerolineaceae bacterium]
MQRRIDPLYPFEQGLLLEVITVDSAQRVQAYAPLEQGLDESLLFRAAAQHGLIPLLYQHLHSLPPNRLNPHLAARCKPLYQANALNNLRLAFHLLQFVDLLSAHGIPCLALKGPALAVQAYGDLSLRQFCDLDVLIHPSDLPHLYELLSLAGSRFTPEFRLSPRQLSRMLRSDKHLCFHYQGGVVEVHWRFSNNRLGSPLEPEEWWQSPATVAILDREVPTLSPQNAVWAACLHGAQHGWSQLKWLADLAHLCQANPRIDWSSLMDHARRTGFDRLLTTALLLAADPGGVSFPPHIQSRLIANRSVVLLAHQVRQQFFLPSPQDVFSSGQEYLRFRERFRDRLHYWLDWFFIPSRSDWLRFDLPASLIPLYFTMRPLRLVCIKGVQSLFPKSHVVPRSANAHNTCGTPRRSAPGRRAHAVLRTVQGVPGRCARNPACSLQGDVPTPKTPISRVP